MPISSPQKIGGLEINGYSATPAAIYEITNNGAGANNSIGYVPAAENSAIYVVVRAYARASTGFTALPVTFSVYSSTGVVLSLVGSASVQVGNTYHTQFVFASSNKVPATAQNAVSFKFKASTSANTDAGTQFGVLAAEMFYVTGVDSRQPFSKDTTQIGNNGTGDQIAGLWNLPHTAADRQLAFHLIRYGASDYFPQLNAYNPSGPSATTQAMSSSTGGGGFGTDPDGYMVAYFNDMSGSDSANLGINTKYPTGNYSVSTLLMVLRSADVSVSLAATGYGSTGSGSSTAVAVQAVMSVPADYRRSGLPAGSFAQVEVISVSPAMAPSVPTSIAFSGSASLGFTMITSRLTQGSGGGYILYSLWISNTPTATTFTTGTYTVNCPAALSVNHNVIVSAVGGTPKSNPLRQVITQGYSGTAGPNTLTLPSTTQETAINGVYVSVASTYASTFNAAATTTPNSSYSSSATAGTASSPSTRPPGWDTTAGAIAYAPVYTASYPAHNTVSSYYTGAWQASATSSSGSTGAAWIVALLEYRSEIALTILSVLGNESFGIGDSSVSIAGPGNKPISFKTFTGTETAAATDSSPVIDSTTLTAANNITFRAVGAATANTFRNVTVTNNTNSIPANASLVVEVWERLTNMNTVDSSGTLGTSYIDDTVTVTGGGVSWNKVATKYAYQRAGSVDGTGQRLTVFTSSQRLSAQAQGALTITVDNPNSITGTGGVSGNNADGLTRVSLTAVSNARSTNFLQIYNMDWSVTTQSSGGGFYMPGSSIPPSGAAKQYFSFWGQNSSATTMTGQDSVTSSSAPPYGLVSLVSNAESSTGINTLQLQSYRNTPVAGNNVLVMTATNGNTPSNFIYFAGWVTPANIPENLNLNGSTPDKALLLESVAVAKVIPDYPVLSESAAVVDSFTLSQIIRGLDDAASANDAVMSTVDSSITVVPLAGNSSFSNAGSGSSSISSISVNVTGLNSYVGSLLMVEVTRGDSTTALQNAPYTGALITSAGLSSVGMTWKTVNARVQATGSVGGSVGSIEQGLFVSTEIPSNVPSGSVTIAVAPPSYSTSGAVTLHVRVSVVNNARQAKPYGDNFWWRGDLVTGAFGTTLSFSLPLTSESSATAARNRGYVSSGYQFPASTAVQPTTGWTQQTGSASSATTGTTVNGVPFATGNTGWLANDSTQLNNFSGRFLNNSGAVAAQLVLIGVEFVHKSVPSTWALPGETILPQDGTGVAGRVVDLAGESVALTDNNLPPILDLREIITLNESPIIELRPPTQAETANITETISAGAPNYRATMPDTVSLLEAMLLDTRRFIISTVAPEQHADRASVYDYFTATTTQTLGYDGPVNFEDSDLVLTTPSGAYLKFMGAEKGDSSTSVVDLFRVGVMVQVVDEIRLLESMTPPNATLHMPSEITKIDETFRIWDAARGWSTTDEWWSLDDVSLHQQSWNITTLGGSRFGVPAMRGEDVQMSNRPGRIWVPKIPDSRVITLIMWMAAIDPDTRLPPSYDQLIQWNDNWNYLRRLFYSPKRQKTLTRRWKLNRQSPRIEKASAKVQLGGTMEPRMTGRTRAEFTVDLVLADPYFYGPVYEESVKVSLNKSLANRRGIFNPGDDTAGFTNMTVTFFGPLTNPRLVNNSGANGPIWMKLNTANIGTLGAGEQVVFDIETFKATRVTTNDAGQAVGTSKTVTAAVTHSGSIPWFALEPGDNIIVLEAEGGTGSALISYRPPFV